jgi:hypothetical protein
MLLPPALLRVRLLRVIADKSTQGHVVDGLVEELKALPNSYDALLEFANRLADLPIREDWPYVEPNDLPGILAECDPSRELGT